MENLELYFRMLDKKLLERLKYYCHPDAPKEIIVHSKNVFDFSEDYKSEIMRKLFDPSKRDVKVTYDIEIKGRNVTIMRDPVMNGRITVIIHREPKNNTLTFSEAYEILKHVEKILDVNIPWGKPFPRGSC